MCNFREAAASSASRQIEIHAHHQRLRFRIAQPAIIFEHHGTVGGQHQSEIQEARVRNPFLGKPGDRRAHNIFHDHRFVVRRDHPVHGVRAHPAGIGAAVAVEDALVVARGRHRQERTPVGQDNEGKLLALQRCFQQNPRAARAEFVLLHHPANERFGLLARFRDQNALSRAQSVRLHDHRPIHRVERPNRLLGGIK